MSTRRPGSGPLRPVEPRQARAPSHTLAAVADLTTEELTRLLKEAEAAHGEYEREELGGERDEDWPAWYAEFIVNALRDADRG